MNVHRTFRLLASAESAEHAVSKVDADIQCWCEEIDRVARKKILWLRAANISFMFAFAITAGLLVAVAMKWH